MHVYKNHGFALTIGALLAHAPLAGAQSRTLSTDTINIAAASRGGRIINASSVLNDQKEFSADNLLDEQVSGLNGKGSAGWVSNRYDPQNMEQVTIGFKDNGLKTLGRIVINPAAYVARERWARDISVQVTTQNAEVGPYTTVREITLRQSPEPQEFKFLPTEARYVRLVFRTNYGSDRAVGLGEVELYESIANTDKLGDVIGRLENTIAELKKFQQTQSEMAGGSSAVRPVSTTPGAQASNINIASSANGGKIVGVSSVFESERGKGPDPAYGPDKLIDGKILTPKDPKVSSNGWASQGFKPGEQWVILGFKDDRTQPIGKIIINPMSFQPADRWARRVDVQVSSEAYKNTQDLATFRTIKTLTLRTVAVPQEFDLGPVEAKYVRLVFTANGPGGLAIEGINPDIDSDRAVALGEIEIYPPRITSGELTAMISNFDSVLSDLKTLRRNSPLVATSDNAEAEATPAVEENAKDLPDVTLTRINASNTRIKSAQPPTRRK